MQSEGFVAEDPMWNAEEFANGDNTNGQALLSHREDDSRGKLHEILQVVNEVKGALSAIPDMQKSITHIEQTIAQVLSYSKSLVLASGSSPAKEGALLDEKIAQQLFPANSVFTQEYVIVAASTTMPKFILDHTEGIHLREDSERPQRTLSALLFSAMPSEKKKTKNTEIARLHADLKTLIAKVLIVNCSTRARNIITDSAASERASCSMQNSGSITTAAGESVASPPRTLVQAEWMRRGYVRPEIYEEVRKELDGNDATIEKSARRSKKRRLDADADFRDNVSRALLKSVYQIMNTFFRHARFNAKKVFFEQLGCLLCVNAQPKAELTEARDTVDSITDVPLTHPLPGAAISTRDEETNMTLFQELDDSRKEFHGLIQYTASVRDGEVHEPRNVRRRISVLCCALNFCIAFTQSPNSAKFLRTNPHALRMVYIVAVAFRNLLIKFAELYPVRMDDAFKTDWEELVLCWNTFMPGPDGRKKLEQDGLPSMDSAKYNELNTVASEECDGPDPDRDDDDEDAVERDVEDLIIRI
jgi:hypothetical protein